MNRYDEVVERGASFLNVQCINTGRLSAICPFNCPLAQCYGSFTRGLKELGLNKTESIKYGFSLFGASPEEWILLKEAWISLVEKQQKEFLESILIEGELIPVVEEQQENHLSLV